MPLQHIKIAGVRNLKQVSLTDCQRINIIAGPNGSGKTSLLEAIHILGLGRSFRSTRLKPVINHDMADCTIYAELADSEVSSIGVKRSRHGKHAFRINRENIASTAALAEALPLQVINSDSYALVDGGPKARRQFMDWGVFHVKPEFLDYWRRSQRSLKQRNSALRHGKMRDADTALWDRELLASAEVMDRLRQEYLEAIKPLFHKILCRLADLPGVELNYDRGWDQQRSLVEVLQENLPRELKQGYTLAGPHRANIDFRFEGQPAAEVLSRGQQKLVVCALRLAQGQFPGADRANEDKSCIYLLDDLPAELDRKHRGTLCDLLDEMGSQVFITCVDADFVSESWENRADVQVFHVKHGQISPGKPEG